MRIKDYSFDYTKYRDELISILQEISKTEKLNWKEFRQILTKYPKDGNKVFSKNHLVLGYKGLLSEGLIKPDQDLQAKIQMKPMRTQSGVTPVTVLTKPFPCPGKCIFCPNDIRMPKSYLADEPGAQRAERNSFDPYLQTYSRLNAYKNIGHPTDKIELIILGGTWSYYPEGYQIWFIKRCFEALNDFGDGIDKTKQTEKTVENLDRKVLEKYEIDEDDKEKNYNKTIAQVARESHVKLIKQNEKVTWEDLFAEHKRNETNNCRNVGLVIETRPDNISPEEVIRVRKLGCTKTQIGLQSLNDQVLELNNRGHDVKASEDAIELLRWGGFKIHAHWMANLYGSTPEKDIQDYKKLFESEKFRPDELKIYPCSLIESAELMDYYKDGRWKPFTHEELLSVVKEVFKTTPEYNRLTRVIRDIPSTDIVVGNKLTNFRQIAEDSLRKEGSRVREIRAREIKDLNVKFEDLKLDIVKYSTPISEEQFLQFITKEDKIAGFLRLSLPKKAKYKHPFIEELDNSAMIREVHVYGKVVGIGDKSDGKAQHLGLGTQLIEKAKQIAKEKQFEKLAVISAIGTREYYRKRGFEDGEMYQVNTLGG